MQIPRIFLGSEREVSRRVAPLVNAFVRGAEPGSLEFGELMSSAEAPQASLSLNPGRAHSPTVDFHCYAFLWGVQEAKSKKKLDRKRMDLAFGWSLDEPWSFLGTLSQVGTLFFAKVDRAGFVKPPPEEVLRELEHGRPEWYRPFLSAALRHFDVLAAEGQRYTPAPSVSPRDFTRAGRPIIEVLADLGLVKEPDDVDTSEKVRRAIEQATMQSHN